MSHHINPYHYGPGVLGAAPSVTLVDPLWLNTPAPYGPLFMQIDGTAHQRVAAPRAARRDVAAPAGHRRGGAHGPRHPEPGPQPTDEIRPTSSPWPCSIRSPILHLVGGAHNDALMLGLLVCGIAVARRGRPVAGIVLCALAAAMKVPAAIGILYIGWEWMGAGFPLRARIRPVLTAGLISGAVMGALSLVTGLGWSWVLNLGAPGTVRSWVAPATGVGDPAHRRGPSGGPRGSLHTMLSVTRVLGLAVALCAGVWLLLALGPHRVPPGHGPDHAARRGPGAGRPALVPVVGPRAAGAGGDGQGADPDRRPVRRLGLHRPARWSQLLSDLFSADPLAVAVALLACLAILTVPLTPFERERLLPRWRRRHRDGGGPRDAETGPVPEYDAGPSRPARAPGRGPASEHALEDGTSIQRPNLRPTSRSTPRGRSHRPGGGRSRPRCPPRCGRSRCGTPVPGPAPPAPRAGAGPRPCPAGRRRRRPSPPPSWRRRAGPGTATGTRTPPPPALDGDDGGVNPLVARDPGPLSRRGAGLDVEGHGGAEDLGVVDGPDGLGVLGARQPDVHGPIVTAPGPAPGAVSPPGRPQHGDYDVRRGLPAPVCGPPLAQSAEHSHGKAGVVGSIPTGGSPAA